MSEWLKEFSNSTVGSIIVSAVGIIVLVGVVISKTSFGKKALKKLGNEILKTSKDTNVAIQKAEELNKKTKERADKLESDYQNELKQRDEKIEKLENFITGTLKYVNNVNVKKAVENYEKNIVDKIDIKQEKVAENGEKV